MHTYIHTYTHTRTHTLLHTHIYTHKHTHIHRYMLPIDNNESVSAFVNPRTRGEIRHHHQKCNTDLDRIEPRTRAVRSTSRDKCQPENPLSTSVLVQPVPSSDSVKKVCISSSSLSSSTSFTRVHSDSPSPWHASVWTTTTIPGIAPRKIKIASCVRRSCTHQPTVCSLAHQTETCGRRIEHLIRPSLWHKRIRLT